ncbi:uncharacterized protein Z519_12558 [Cladophialophora bantiana CBS 173.52]|uniref:Major facilitator superfamily (MFS) profile domain-containing protein n=1 Tax=Cladophialophora bantiana (strain ATCC 10958 / CBS 173.52 / CDC B-1940 / NIH 8579) TaxID=1442370 RepID=A0A0D2FJ92_CLAB1|nr:uncharacterized protein Z519_12558 [Cladophialophora bantiana CBS 173.52]KIW86772.1 hypothetical protein Z519_12558 [Cladophialophora bantiana CBS 173.52]
MGVDIVLQENIEQISMVGQPKPSIHKIGEELLDSHIHDDHGDPHGAALNDEDADGKVKATTWAAVFFLGITYISSLSFTLNSFASIATSVAMELQGNLNNLNWVSGGFSLGGSVAFALAGGFSDYLGRKDVIVTGQIILLIGHLVGATAQSFEQIVAAMTLLGVGTGITFVIYVGISEILPNKWRSFGMATTEINLTVLGTFGPLMGRGLTQNATWRWLFILGDIVGLIAVVGTVIFYHPPRRIFQDRTKRQVLYELDYVGIFLYTAGVTVFLLGLGWPGTRYEWQSAAVIVPLTIGGVLFLCTFAWDFSGRAARPLFPYRLFRRFKEFTSLIIIMFSSGLAHIALTTFMPQQIAYVFTSNQVTAGWYNVPTGIGALIGGGILGALVPQIKHIPLQLLAANAIQALGCGLLVVATPHRIAGGLIIQGIANIPFPWVMVIGYSTVGLHVPQRDIGLAYGLLGAVRYLGGAMGSTIFNTVLNDRVLKSVPKRVVEAVVPLGFPVADVSLLIAAVSSRQSSAMAGFPAEMVAAATEAMRWGYSDAFRYVWYSSIPFFVMACVVSVFVLDPSPYFTNHTAVETGDGGVASRLRRGRAQGRGHSQSHDYCPEKATIQEHA